MKPEVFDYETVGVIVEQLIDVLVVFCPQLEKTETRINKRKQGTLLECILKTKITGHYLFGTHVWCIYR